MPFRSSKFIPLIQQIRQKQCCKPCPKLRHLICFKQWTDNMVMEIIVSAMNLKYMHRNTHNCRLKILNNSKVMILQEINEPVLNMAVSKAATLLGAYDVNIIDQVIWGHDYYGSIFSFMSDVIFVSTNTHMCVKRFANKSTVPVICMKSRTHASIQALATVMAIMEELGTLRCVNVAYLGAPHPVLNSYLLLCPMLGANFRFKCCCDKCPVSPLLKKTSEEIATNTEVMECKHIEDVLYQACVIISGPTASKGKASVFKIDAKEIYRNTCCNWIYFHTCPRGQEVDDNLFYHDQSRTFHAYENMHYIAAALMANAIQGYKF